MIKKAIIPVAGLGTRFLPLSKEFPKEMWPLGDKPVLQYIVEEVLNSKIKEIIFVLRPEKNLIFNYFTKIPSPLKKILKERKKEEILKELNIFYKTFKKAKFFKVFQKEQLGDGHAILQAQKKAKRENVAVLFGDDVIEAEKPALLQMIEIFKKYKKPIIGLFEIEKEKISNYGVVAGKEIEDGVLKLEKIVEKPKIEQAPSNLAIVGRYILTPEVFDYLKRTLPGKTKEIHLSETFQKMIAEKKEILGYKIKGNWLECGTKISYLKSFVYLSLKNRNLSEEIRKFLPD